MVARWFSVNLETFTKGCGFEPHGLRAFLFFFALLCFIQLISMEEEIDVLLFLFFRLCMRMRFEG